MTIKELLNYRLFTVSNLLSLMRVFLLPLLWFTISRTDTTYSNFGTLIILGIMVITDFLDGFLARMLGQETPLGQYLDPVADKIAIVTGFLLLTYYRNFPVWVTVFIILREILGTWLGGFLLIKRNILGKPNYWGKLGVSFCAFAGMFYLLDLPHKELTIIPIIITLTGGIIIYSKTYWRTVFKVYRVE